MGKRKLTDISKIKDEKVVLTNQSANLNNHPEINFKYLWKCNEKGQNNYVGFPTFLCCLLPTFLFYP